MPDLLTIIKRAAMDAVENTKPADACFGTVISASPLQVRVEQKLTLGANQLLVPERLTDHDAALELDAQTASGGEDGHTHALPGQLTVRLLCGLKAGDGVLLLRMAGGQKYIILDRVVSA